MTIERLAEIPGMDAPCRRHPSETAIAEAVENWTVARGLMPRAVASRARFHGFASRAFPESDVDTAVLCGQWLAWLFACDDARDGDSALDRTVIDMAFDELWQATSIRTGADWQHRFQSELLRYQQSEAIEATNRTSGRFLRISEYEQFRRVTNGRFMFLLPEALMSITLPQSIVDTPAWCALEAASDDVTAWCNDIVSVEHEAITGDTTNYVLVFEHELGISRDAAISLVCTRIADRMAEMSQMAKALPAEFTRLELSRSAALDASKVAMTLLSAPRVHLEWIWESDRYRVCSSQLA